MPARLSPIRLWHRLAREGAYAAELPLLPLLHRAGYGTATVELPKAEGDASIYDLTLSIFSAARPHAAAARSLTRGIHVLKTGLPLAELRACTVALIHALHARGVQRVQGESDTCCNCTSFIRKQGIPAVSRMMERPPNWSAARPPVVPC